MKTAKPSPAKKPRTAGSTSPESEGLPVRQLKLIGVAALLFGIVTAIVMNRDLMFPTPPEKVVEVVWTHECICATGWLRSLRRDGFTVRDFEMDDLRSARRQWQVPGAATGCHPGRYMGYVLDGHVPGELLLRLTQEHPQAVAVLQVRTSDPKDVRFELLAQDGRRRAWP